MDDGEKWDLGRRTEKISIGEHGDPVSEPDTPSVPPASFRRMGMWLFLASLGILFAAVLVGFLVLRSRVDQWPSPGAPPLPAGLWICTALLVLLSVVLVLAERGVRSNRPHVLRRFLTVSVLLAVAFLAAQVSNWMRMAAHSVAPDENLFVWFFYLLTILHAAHVFFGLVPLALVSHRARGGRYTVDDREGIHLVAMYWHFLLATWIAIMAVMVI